MNKERKKSNFLRSLLTTASVASVIVGASSSAFGVATPNGVITNAAQVAVNIGDNAATGNWHRIDNNGTLIAGPVAVDGPSREQAFTFGRNGTTVKINVDRTVRAISAGGKNDNTVLLSANLITGSVVNFVGGGGGAANKHVDFTFDAAVDRNVTLTLTGESAVAGTHGFNAAVNDFSGVRNIDFGVANAYARTLHIAPTTSSDIVFADLVILNGQNATLDITNIGHVTTFNKAEVATAKTININDGSTLQFDSSVTGGNALNLQQARDDVINFGDTGTGRLLLTSKVGAATNFQVMNGSLGGAIDDYGVIHFKTTAVAGTLSAVNKTVIGRDEDNRAKKLKVITVVGNNATIQGKVYTKELELNGGISTFTDAVYVGNDGITNFTAASTVTFNDDANLGKVDFQANSTIIIGANKNLSGNFYGDANKRLKNKIGTLSFSGNSEFDGTVTDLALIEHTAAGTLKFTKAGTNIVTKIQGAVGGGGSIFDFVNDYKLIGNIERARTLNFENAEVAGNITDVNGINIAQDKTLMVGGTHIEANTILFGNAKGTLSLNSAGNVLIKSVQIGESGGNIDATKMADKKTLTIIGNIGTDPAIAGNMPLDKILLSGQNLSLQPANGKSVNIAGMEFNEKASTIVLKTVGIDYALGELKKANKAKIEISEDVSLLNTKTTGDDKLEEINFKGDKTLTLKGGMDITVGSITTHKDNQGKIIFDETSALKGNIGTYSRIFNALQVNDSVEATTSGKAYLTDIALGDSSILVVDNDYKVKKFAVKTDGSGILRFTNNGAATFETNTITAPAGRVRAPVGVKALAALELQGDGNVTLKGNGLKFKKIAFSKGSTLILPNDMKLSGIEVESTVADKRPTIRLASAINQDEIISGQNIGSGDHPVNLAFTADTILDVKSQKAFVGVTTVVKEKGTVNYDLGKGVDGAIYGLGSENYNLKLVNLKSKVTNYGDTFANKVVVHDNVYYAAGGTVDGAIQLGHTETDAGGVASVEFRDNVILKADMTSMGAKNTIAFAGNAEISSKTFGTAKNAFETINFTGDNTHTATLKSSDLHAKNINFGNENIKIAAKKVALHGISQNNANIDLESNQLSLKKSGTWGEKTSIHTDLTEEGSFGNIVLKDKVTVNSGLGIVVRISDKADLDKFSNKKFILIDGNNNLVLEGGAVNLVKDGLIKDRAYIDWIIKTEGDQLVFERKVDVKAGITEDMKKAGASYQYLANIDNFVKAKKFMNDLSFIYPDQDNQDDEEKQSECQKKRFAAMKKIESNDNDKVTGQVAKVGEMFNAALRNRMSNVVVAAGSDDSSMGAWAMPYYSQATQNKSGDDAGYGVKSFGGVVGFDTLVNDDLTIGAAVSFVKSDMKYKGDYAGKTEIGTFMGSIYAAQSLPQNFFVQAVASLGSSKIKGTDPRIVSTKTHSSGQETAKADYGTMSYGGEVLFGYNAKIADSALLTPMAGIRYTRFNDESYKEAGTTNQNKIVGERSINNIEAIIGAKASTSIDTDGVVVTPELHAFVSQKLGANSLGKVDVRLEGMTDSFITKSEKAAKTSFNVGLGVIAKAGVMEYGAGYDAYLANKYVGHQGTLKVRVNF
ncbi:autotransporter outer membrane beta-barrel domain-containing protein [Rickettsia endosymbiont of Oedothorax gibbosus]|uniref:autotransporter outer membrane beta-barrel domain-containing protein n=1 Tax=Rickettsia endosymbiont of Oedothorax gibbosus TaxID=931099 RepID=UPI0020240F98|nr:autotransporter outer membrane beta-barrel domain-containing protein [Rickettsia endosymbiont of Oedothorax gibbosus]